MMSSPPLPLEKETMLRSELNSREKLLWTGQPLANRAMWGNLHIVVVGIPWTAISVFWIYWTSDIGSGMNHTSSSPTPLSFDLFSLMFHLIGGLCVVTGLGMLSAPYWMWRKAKKTVYALTDKRALILSPTWRGEITVRSLGPEHLTTRKRMTNPDGSGTIVFPALTTLHRAAVPEGGMYAVNVGFEHIADVRGVDALIGQTYRASA